mmetsp:Transcript_10190/g.42716  ORF Transcript_10190/g.42716 Transcript_10190/m.42716 type:complete len:216 (-) Transcript_10190:1002-1649(-)
MSAGCWMLQQVCLERSVSWEGCPADFQLLFLGTADVAVLAAEMNDHVNVVGIDPSQKMLDIGKGKVMKKQMTERVQLLIGKAEDLSQFKEGSFDHEIVSFGVRNFQDREAGLKEMARVLKKNGRVAILELTGTDENEKGPLSPAREFFISTVMPFIGGLISGKRETYGYLHKSSASFPAKNAFADMLRAAGFKIISQEHLTPFGLGPLLTVAEKA